MPLPATYTKVTMYFSNPTTNAKAQCVLWYLISAGTTPSLSTVVTHANSFRTAYSTAIAAALPTACNLDKVTLRWVSGGSEVEGDNSNGVVAGTVSGDVLPEEDVIVIQRRTGFVGRNKRGRIFFPFVPEAFQADGALNSTGLTAAAGLAAMVKSNVVSGATTYNPQTPNWKDGGLLAVTQAGYVTTTCSRRDRRSPKTLFAVHV